MSSSPSRRDVLRRIAETTIQDLERGSYDMDGHTYPLHTQTARQGTLFFAPDALWNWQSFVPHAPRGPRVHISILEISTIDGARLLSTTLSQLPHRANIGVLNFASAKKPGGGFMNGAQAQEESIARSSTLFPTLCTSEAGRFYDLHRRHPRTPFYSHAMIFSPEVEIFRDDEGRYVPPIKVDVVTCAAVNAGVVRKSKMYQSSSDEIEKEIESVMKERMARILHLFEQKDVRNLVLGSFGTGVFCNKVVVVARSWADLLSCPRFRYSFDRVVFAILGRPTYTEFANTYEAQASVLIGTSGAGQAQC